MITIYFQTHNSFDYLYPLIYQPYPKMESIKILCFNTHKLYLFLLDKFTVVYF